jgi:Domain found in Dishevelled, Egl-10, and Pleckstrin (DEP)/RhoGAP domain
MVEATKNHQKIASNIRELVVSPFSRWCDAHSQRVQNSQDDLQSKIKAHDKQAEVVKKLRSHYFNKCRLVEDLEEEKKLAFPTPEKEQSPPKPQSPPPPKIVLPEDEPEELPVEIGDETYSPEQIKKILTHMLNTIPLGDAKVPILGTYQNCSAGTDIAEYIQKNMRASNVSFAERIGQDMVDRGFLRLVGNVGNTFANSSKMKYQWRPKVFQMTGVPERKKAITRVGSASSQDGILESPVVANISETLAGWNPLSNPHPNETPAERLRRESREADEKYKAAVRRLDLLRCNLEESMMDHLKFLERCELDRLRAIKAVILDFSGAVSNVIPGLQSQVDNMMLYQETIQPLGDLRYMLENYRSGAFIPKAIPYENYYGSVDDQTFGVDLEARARADRKRVPLIITTLLTFLDNHYPDLEGDEARRSIWTVDVPLAATHHLRNVINNGAPIPREVLERYEIPIVASALKLYLLELPGMQNSPLALPIGAVLTFAFIDTLVSSQVYEIIKTIYATTSDAEPNPISADATDSAPRIQVLQSTLGQLRLNNIATLDAITTHFTRLIDLTSADEAYVTNLAQVLAPCILRPRSENALTMDERHSYRLVRDLFDHKEAIFGELKRQSASLGHLGGPAASFGGSTRARAVSNSDESNRRANMEARMKAVSERTRDKSPVATNRHRREKSTEGSVGTRFPINVTPTAVRSSLNSPVPNRQSLEVPGSIDNSPVVDTTQPSSKPAPTHFQDSRTNDTTAIPTEQMPGAFSGGGPGPHIPPMDDSPITEPSSAGINEPEMGKQNSIKRSPVGSGGKGRRGVKPGNFSLSNHNSLEGVREGVTLSDKPMDD